MKIKELLIEQKMVTTQFIINHIMDEHNETLPPDFIKHLNDFKGFILKTIPVQTIKTDSSAPDKDKVAQYDDVKNSPPIVMGGDYLLDGYHRVTAAKALGMPTIKAYVGHGYKE